MTYESVQKEVRLEFPTYSEISKADSRLMLVIDWFLKVITLGMMRRFMTDFVTTIGTTVYVPKYWETELEATRIVILRHERVHMRQRQRYGAVLYALLYLFLPFPLIFAYFRMRLEQEAYEESMVALADLDHNAREVFFSDWYRTSMVGHFTSAEYFWMWPFRRSVEQWYYRAVRKALS